MRNHNQKIKQVSIKERITTHEPSKDAPSRHVAQSLELLACAPALPGSGSAPPVEVNGWLLLCTLVAHALYRGI